jgi:hypothetical protein
VSGHFPAEAAHRTAHSVVMSGCGPGAAEIPTFAPVLAMTIALS